MAVRAQEQNLDSLLDTMANVVGILVVLVAVTQLSVGEAVDRIAGRYDLDRSEVSAEDVSAASASAEAVATAVVAAEGELDAYASSAKRVGWLLEEIAPHLEELEGLAGRDDLAGAAEQEMAERIRQRRFELERLASEVAERRSRLAGLEALIASVPAETRPKIARLPDPRTPPRGARQVPVLCRYGRCSLLDYAGMNAMLSRGIEDALGVDRRPARDDVPWLRNLFAKKRIGSGNFYWGFRESSGDILADILWSDVGHGETLVELARPGSELVQSLSEIDRGGHYLRFYVWNDSFEVYLEARYVAEQLGWEIGWLPIDGNEEVGINLTGRPRRATTLD